MDLKYALRMLRHAPGFTIMAVLCIALGVGVTTTIFSAVNGILIRPLPYPHPEQLVSVYARYAAHGEHGVNISFPDYLSWRDENRSFSRLGMWTWNTLTLSGEGEPERVEAAQVTANLFPLLGVQPLLGRNFAAEEDRPGQGKVLLLGYGLWQRRFAGDRSIVGRPVSVDGVVYTVVGVMPQGFTFPERGQAWTLFAIDAAKEGRGNRYFAGAIGRLKPGVTLAKAQSDLATISSRLQRAYSQDNFGWDAEALTLRDDLVGDLRKPLLLFLGAVGFVLLIACANVANLMLARAASRQREIAIRVAVGAGRGRLVRQILTESMVLAAIGGGVGVLVASFGVDLLKLGFPGDIPGYIAALEIDRTVLAFTLLLSAVTGIVFGLAPALRASRVELSGSLKEGTRGGGDSLGRNRMRGALVVTEVALSLVLMIGASLLIRSYRALETTKIGFDAKGILSLRVSLPPTKYASSQTRVAFFDALTERVRALPGVESVGAAQGIPFSGWNIQADFTIEGRPAPKQGEEFVSHYQTITPDYFKTIGVPLLRGRGIQNTDRDTSVHVGVINESFAKRAFPGQDPIGKRVHFGGPSSRDPWITIVGIARDYRHYRLPQPMGPAIFASYFTDASRTQTLAIRTSLADPLSLTTAVRASIHDVDENVPAYQVQTFEQVLSRSLWRQRLQGQVLGVFAVMALLLATVGIYGVISYTVAQRTRELGLRMALGASRGHVLALVVGQGTRLALIGVAIGIAGALALSRVVSGLLYGVQPTDLVTFIGVPIVLAGVAVLASYVPALRATKLDPVVALRND
ncbi:MAG: ABC transporter permease [Gemmatimonadota bacterium]|nr:ABC transporter permease [Gemmatimonadota bacterium]